LNYLWCTGCTGISWGTANLAIEVSTIWGGGIFTTGLSKTGAAAGAEPPNIAAAAPTPTKAAIQGIAIAQILPADNPLLLFPVL